MITSSLEHAIPGAVMIELSERLLKESLDPAKPMVVRHQRAARDLREARCCCGRWPIGRASVAAIEPAGTLIHGALALGRSSIGVVCASPVDGLATPPSLPLPVVITLVRILLAILAIVTSSAGSLAQCNNSYLPGTGLPGVGGQVRVLAEWDPDGPGPLTNLVVVGGLFTGAGDVLAKDLAAWDPATGSWDALGGGVVRNLTTGVSALLALPNGDLVVGGNFTVAGATPAKNIARWDGANWHAMGAGLGSGLWEDVRSLVRLPNGDILAGGSFLSSGSQPIDYIARWDGSSWQPVAGGTGWYVNAMQVMPNGDVVVAGAFTTAGGQAALRIARWNGSSWSALAGGGCSHPISGLASAPNGDLVAVGEFTLAGDVAASRVARWDGQGWSAVGTGANGWVSDACFDLAGDLFISGTFSQAGGAFCKSIARWDGIAWSQLGTGITTLSSGLAANAALALPTGQVVFGGSFSGAGDLGVNSMALWDGSWHRVEDGFQSVIVDLAELPNGDLVAVGPFLAAPGADARYIASLRGGVWSALGGSPDDRVYCALTLANGDLLVGGRFLNVGGVPMRYIARWDGVSWSPLGGTLSDEVQALLELPNGDIVAAGNFLVADGQVVYRIARWDGTSWSPMGAGFGSWTVRSLAQLANGDVVAAGSFSAARGPAVIARWNGTAWLPLGAGLNGAVWDLQVMQSGDLVAVGSFTASGSTALAHVARWDGSNWFPYGNGLGEILYAVAEAPNGDLIVGGNTQAMRWNGASWAQLETGVSASGVWSLAMRGNGELAVGGTVFRTHGGSSVFFTILATDCPAMVTTVGSSCAGTAGSAVLAADTLPFVGATLKTSGTNLPSPSVLGTVFGFATPLQPLSLSTVWPQAVVGCDLLVHPDLLYMSICHTGEVAMQLAIPNAPSLVGQPLFQQLVPFEIDDFGNVVAVTSSNALAFTFGSF